jgi:hypothetical protein
MHPRLPPGLYQQGPNSSSQYPINPYGHPQFSVLPQPIYPPHVHTNQPQSAIPLPPPPVMMIGI